MPFNLAFWCMRANPFTEATNHIADSLRWRNDVKRWGQCTFVIKVAKPQLCSSKLPFFVFMILQKANEKQHRNEQGSAHAHTRGDPKNPELSPGGRAPCSTGFPCSVSLLGPHLYQCASWCCCKSLHSASVNFFWRLFQCSCPFPDGWFTTAPAHTVLSVQQFWIKSRMTPCPTLPIYLILPWATFLLFPYMKKILKGKCFIVVKEVKQKTSEALKGIKMDEFKSCFKQGKNSR